MGRIFQIQRSGGSQADNQLFPHRGRGLEHIFRVIAAIRKFHGLSHGHAVRSPRLHRPQDLKTPFRIDVDDVHVTFSRRSNFDIHAFPDRIHAVGVIEPHVQFPVGKIVVDQMLDGGRSDAARKIVSRQAGKTDAGQQEGTGE